MLNEKVHRSVESFHDASEFLETPSADLHIFKLQKSMLKSIFTYLNYTDIVKLRYVCRLFNEAANEILNECFLQIGDQIDGALEQTARILKNSTPDQNIIRYFKILYFVRSEYNIIKALIHKYLNNCTFTGGTILDHFVKVLSMDYKQIRHNQEYIKIFNIVGTYLDHFDKHIDLSTTDKEVTQIKKSGSWFGTKLLNVLDASLELNHNLELSFGANCMYMDGEYYGEELFLFENLPTINKKIETDDEMRHFIQCIRNNIRWNNLIYCIERSTTELAQNYNELELKIKSQNNLILKKAVVRCSKENEKGITYSVSIKCSKDELPVKYLEIVRNNPVITTTQSRTKQYVEDDDPYEFNLIMKVRIRLDEGQIKEKVIKVYHVGEECIISETNRIPQNIEPDF